MADSGLLKPHTVLPPNVLELEPERDDDTGEVLSYAYPIRVRPNREPTQLEKRCAQHLGIKIVNVEDRDSASSTSALQIERGTLDNDDVVQKIASRFRDLNEEVARRIAAAKEAGERASTVTSRIRSIG